MLGQLDVASKLVLARELLNLITYFVFCWMSFAQWAVPTGIVDYPAMYVAPTANSLDPSTRDIAQIGLTKLLKCSVDCPLMPSQLPSNVCCTDPHHCLNVHLQF